MQRSLHYPVSIETTLYTIRKIELTTSIETLNKQSNLKKYRRRNEAYLV